MAVQKQAQVRGGLSLQEAYAKVQRWYRKNVDQLKSRQDEYGHASQKLIRGLPRPQSASELEIRAVFEEILTGLLEWAYGESDGEHTMAEYAQMALEAAGLPRALSERELEELRTTSKLWYVLSRGVRSRSPGERVPQQPSAEPEAPDDGRANNLANQPVDIPREPPVQVNATPAAQGGLEPQPSAAALPPPAARLHSDLWAKKDELGFALYAKTIVEFIDHTQTSPPLTVAILAPWGRGKTTLMRLVREQLARKARGEAPSPVPPAVRPQITFGGLREWLRNVAWPEPERLKYPSVWFNAWKFQSSEQVWAGLAHEIISQLVQQLPNEIEREKFWLALQLRRLDTAAIRRDLRGMFLEAAAGRVVSWGSLGFFVLLALVAGVASWIGSWNPLETGWKAGLSALGVALGSALIQAYRAHQELMKKPLEGAYAKYVRQPDYSGKRGMLSEVEEDIRLVFQLLVDEQKPAVVFVDDLDRCSPGKVAEVMEGVNLFLSGDFPNCYFVIGVDAQVVAASMEVAHKELAEKLAHVARGYGSLGWYFMDKFIQLPFVIPTLSEQQRAAFLGVLFDSRSRPTPAGTALAAQAERAIRAFEASSEAASALVQQAAQWLAPLRAEDPDRARQVAYQALEIGAVRFRDEDPEIQGQLARYADWLGPSPRTIKRFANLYRFYRMVQWSRELQGQKPAPPPALGRWLVLMLRWPQLVRWIQWEGEAHLLPTATDPYHRAAQFEHGVLRATSHPAWLQEHGLAAIPWCADGQLFEFLRATANPDAELHDALETGVW